MRHDSAPAIAATANSDALERIFGPEQLLIKNSCSGSRAQMHTPLNPI